MVYEGSGVAIITPMHMDGSIDIESYKKLLKFHMNSGTDAVILVGTTGESATLTEAEKIQLFEIATEELKNSPIKRIFNLGSNNTHQSIEFAKKVEFLKPDAGMFITPYYNKSNQIGMLEHYKQIAKSLPNMSIMLYDVPGRTAVRLAKETILSLAEIDNIVAYKDATADGVTALEIIDKTRGKLDVYVASDPMMFFYLCAGAKGVNGVLANVLPKEVSLLCKTLLKEKDFQKGREQFLKMLPVANALFMDTSPLPVKEALCKMGLIEYKTTRLPLFQMEESLRQRFLDIIKKEGLI